MLVTKYVRESQRHFHSELLGFRTGNVTKEAPPLKAAMVVVVVVGDDTGLPRKRTSR